MSIIKSELQLNAASVQSGVRSVTSIICLLVCAAVLLAGLVLSGGNAKGRQRPG